MTHKYFRYAATSLLSMVIGLTATTVVAADLSLIHI